MIKYSVHIKGIAPLLFNRFPEEDNPEDKSKAKKAILHADSQVYQSLYWLKPMAHDAFVKTVSKEGHYKVPVGAIFQKADHILGAMIKAGSNFKLEGKKTYKDLVKGGFFVEPMQIPHIKTDLQKDWRPVLIPATRGRVMKGRGRLDDWELKFDLVCVDPRANKQEVLEILKYAGSYVGIGDYRPRYGRFEVVDAKLVEVK